jgi:hypothetical protein
VAPSSATATRVAPAPLAPSAPSAPLAPAAPAAPLAPGGVSGDLKDAFLAQLKASKVFFYNTVVAQAYRVDVSPSRITFTFLPNQRVPRQQCEEMKAFLEEIAQKVSGTRIPVVVTVTDGAAAAVANAPVAPVAPVAPGTVGPPDRTAPASDEESLRREAMADPSVQALFEIFPVEKSKVEEM